MFALVVLLAGHAGGGGRALGVGEGLGSNPSSVAVSSSRRRRVPLRLTHDSGLGRGRGRTLSSVGHRLQGRRVNLGPGRDPCVALELAHVGRVLDAERVGGGVVQIDLKWNELGSFKSFVLKFII